MATTLSELQSLSSGSPSETTDNKKNIKVFELKLQTTHGKSELIGYTDVPKFFKALKFHFNPIVILKDLSCVC